MRFAELPQTPVAAPKPADSLTLVDMHAAGTFIVKQLDAAITAHQVTTADQALKLVKDIRDTWASMI